MMDRLASIAVFVTVVEAGSFAAAAARSHLSPQMVAKHVATLEARLGARLLNRTTRRQSLTELGRRYYEQCRVVLAEAEAADSLADELRAVPRGRLRLSAPIIFGSLSLTPLVTRFLRDYPEVEIDFTLSDRLVDLVEEGIDLAFRIGAPSLPASLTAHSLRAYRLLVCASPAYLAARGTPAVPADLVGHECLSYTFASRPPERDWHFTRNGEVHQVRVESRLQANDTHALLAAALDHYGIVLGAEALLAPAVADGRLVRLLPDYEAPSRPMHLLHPAERRRSPKIARFVELTLEIFG